MFTVAFEQFQHFNTIFLPAIITYPRYVVKRKKRRMAFLSTFALTLYAKTTRVSCLVTLALDSNFFNCKSTAKCNSWGRYFLNIVLLVPHYQEYMYVTLENSNSQYTVYITRRLYPTLHR